MLWKLTRFELKKMLGGKFFLIALCLLLLVNMFLLCGLQEFNETRETMEEIGMEWDVDFWTFRDNNLRWTQIHRESYGLLAALTPEEEAEYEQAMLDKYGEGAFDLGAQPMEMMAPPGYFGETQSDAGMAMNYVSMKEANEEDRNAFAKTIQAAQSYGREALAEGDNYGVRRNLQIIRLYSLPRGERNYPIVSWDEFLLETHTMLFVFLMVLLACAGSFTAERDRQTLTLLHTSKNGKGKTLLAKYLAGAITAAGLTVLFQLSSFAIISWKAGFLGAGEPVSALDALKMFPFLFTVWQYALLSLGCQIFSAVVLSVLLNTVSAVSKNSVIAYVAGALLLGGCALLVYDPPRSEWLAGPLSLSQPLRYFDSWYTANLFGFPVLWVLVQAVLWTVVGGACIHIAHKVYHRKGRAV